MCGVCTCQRICVCSVCGICSVYVCGVCSYVRACVALCGVVCVHMCVYSVCGICSVCGVYSMCICVILCDVVCGCTCVYGVWARVCAINVCVHVRVCVRVINRVISRWEDTAQCRAGPSLWKGGIFFTKFQALVNQTQTTLLARNKKHVPSGCSVYNAVHSTLFLRGVFGLV